MPVQIACGMPRTSGQRMDCLMAMHCLAFLAAYFFHGYKHIDAVAARQVGAVAGITRRVDHSRPFAAALAVTVGQAGIRQFLSPTDNDLLASVHSMCR